MELISYGVKITDPKPDEADKLALTYWNSIKTNYPNLQPDSSDFWECAPTHLAKVVRELLARQREGGGE